MAFVIAFPSDRPPASTLPPESSMLVCHTCSRHYRFEDARCPFCSTPHRTVGAGIGAAAALASGLMLFACTRDDDESSDTSDATDTTGDETGETGDSTDTDTGDTTTTTTTESGGTEYGAAPVPEPD
jgi:hypothetical protein